MDLGHQLGLGWSRADDGRASRPARTGLAPVAILDRNERAEGSQSGFCNSLVRVNGEEVRIAPSVLAATATALLVPSSAWPRPGPRPRACLGRSRRGVGR